MTRTFGGALLALGLLAPAMGSAQDAAPEDVASPEAIILAAYDAIGHAPGEGFDWDRFRSLHLPGAILLPNPEQTEGEERLYSVDEFIAWIDSAMPPSGSENDAGFVEEQIHIDVERYGDIAQAMSTYQKRFFDDDEILGRGINSFNLVYRQGRWWIAAIAWDEENGGGPIPDAYLP